MKCKDAKIDETMLYSLFIFADDACQSIENYIQTYWLEQGNSPQKKGKRPALSESEIITILVYDHY